VAVPPDHTWAFGKLNNKRRKNMARLIVSTKVLRSQVHDQKD